MEGRGQEQTLDDYFQLPSTVSRVGKSEETQHFGNIHDEEKQQDSVRLHRKSVDLRAAKRHSVPRSYLATDLSIQQTSPRPYLPGPIGRKGRMLLGAGFPPPAAPYNQFKNRHKAPQNRMDRHASGLQRWHNMRRNGHSVQRSSKRMIVDDDRSQTGNYPRNIDPREPQYFEPSERERQRELTQFTRGEKISHIGDPRCQEPVEGAWTYRDKVLARYQNYAPGRDVPNPRRPMARTEEQLRRPLTPIEKTSLHSTRRPRIQPEQLISPRVHQSVYNGGYQARMSYAQSKIGKQKVPKNCHHEKKYFHREKLLPSSSSNFFPGARIPLYGPKEVAGKTSLVAPQPIRKVRPQDVMPRRVPQGPIRGVVAKPSPPMYHERKSGWGGSKEHGRPGRVGFW